MSGDYPDYFPPFMRDFHDGKDFMKAFYVWRVLNDQKLIMDGKLDDDYGKRISQMSDPLELQILFASLLDFLRMNGWQLYRSRGKGEFADIGASVDALNDLQSAWWSLLEPPDGLKMRPEMVEKIMVKWANWLEYMPKAVQVAYAEFKERGGV